MSKTSAETSLALFERTNGRGDVLSIHLEDGAALAALPKEMFTEILYPLFQWWVKGSDVEPSDPRDRMVFEGLKTHQIENAVRRGVSLKNWHENALKGGRPKTPKKPLGNQVLTKRVQLEDQDTSIKTEDASSKSSVLDTSLSVSADAGRTCAARSADLSVEEAKQILAKYAPPILSHSQMLNPNGDPRPNVRKFIETSADSAAAIVGQKLFPTDFDTENEDIKELLDGGYLDDVKDYLPKGFFKSKGGAFVKTIISVLDEIFSAFNSDENGDPTDMAEDVFKRALLDGYLSAVSDQTVTNRPGWIIARLKKVRDAVRAIKNAPPLEV